MAAIIQDDIRNYTAEEVANIVHRAQVAAREESERYLRDTLKGKDDMPCGFASVEIYEVRANSKAGKVLAAAGMRKTGGYWWWNNPGGLLVQNVHVKAEGASAAAQVLRDYHFRAYAVDRLD